MITIKEVSEDFLRVRSEIDALDQELAKERRAIQNKAINNGRLMSNLEKTRRKDIGATRQELAEALEVISLVTLERLNGSGGLCYLNQEIERLNDMLMDDLGRLKKIEEYADKTAKVVSGLARAAKQVTKMIT